MRLIDMARARWRLLSSRTDTDARFAHEVEFHIQMESERLQREEHVDPSQARRRAVIAFGGVERHKEALRDVRGLRWLGGLTLDLKLGLRMMARWPGLTFVGVLGISVAVAIGTFAYGMIDTLVGPTIPIDEGNRLVMVVNWDARSSSAREETHLHDMSAWRHDIDAIGSMGAFRIVKRNLLVPGARPDPVQVAEMTASGFTIARATPLMGRFLLDEDERPGSPQVVVIGEDVWRNRFGGAPDIIGKTMQLGTTLHVIVGVMPSTFLFPVNNRIWIPLRLDPLRFEPGNAPSIKVFGRLAYGASISDATKQAARVAARLAPDRPRNFDQVRTQVLEYGSAFAEDPSISWALQLIKVAVSLLLVVIGINVATLVFARTAGRMGEFAVRTALGASRSRIVLQLFAEAFVLSIIASVIGFVAAVFAFRYLGHEIHRLTGDAWPYWFDPGVSRGMLAYVIAMAVLGAFLMGALPALKATGRNVRLNMQAMGGGGGVRLGKSWTFMIVGQVAVAVTLLPIVVHFAVVKPMTERVYSRKFDTHEWTTATVYLDRIDAVKSSSADSMFNVRYTVQTAEFVRRLRSDASVADAVLMSGVPGAEATMRVEPEVPVKSQSTAASSAMFSVGYADVQPEFFRAFEIPVVQGRALISGDASSGSNTIVVNQPFVTKVFGGGNAVGRHVRTAAMNDTEKAGPWLEIVGVVPDFPGGTASTRHPMVYRAMNATMDQQVVVAVRARGVKASSLSSAMRESAVAIDPLMRVENIKAIDDAEELEQSLDRVIFTGIFCVTVAVVLLSAAGVYALMSFTIARRRREIGIRAALGAGSRQIVSGVLSHAARQVALGILIGTTLDLLLIRITEGWRWDTRGLISVGSVVLFMSIVAICAAWAPARSALRIQPTEALRSES